MRIHSNFKNKSLFRVWQKSLNWIVHIKMEKQEILSYMPVAQCALTLLCIYQTGLSTSLALKLMSINVSSLLKALLIYKVSTKFWHVSLTKKPLEIPPGLVPRLLSVWINKNQTLHLFGRFNHLSELSSLIFFLGKSQIPLRCLSKYWS